MQSYSFDMQRTDVSHQVYDHLFDNTIISFGSIRFDFSFDDITEDTHTWHRRRTWFDVEWCRSFITDAIPLDEFNFSIGLFADGRD